MKKIGIISLVFLAAFTQKCYSKNTENIKIGGLFDASTNDAQLAFQYAVQQVNTEIGGKLEALTAKVVYGDEFEASGKLCKLLKDGVLALLGPSSPESFNHVKSICENKKVPLITTSYDDSFEDPVVNLHPHPPVLEKAIVDLLDELEWEKFTILYENGPWISQIGELLEVTDEKDYIVRIIELNKTNENYRSTLMHARNTGDTNFVICCSTDTLDDVLKHAQQVGMMTVQFNYIIASLDLHTVDLEPYQYSGVDITGIRIIDPSKESVKKVAKGLNTDHLTLEAALAYDSVILFSETLKQNSHMLNKMRMFQADCDNKNATTMENILMKTIKNVSIDGLTGRISFDEEGKRSEFQLDLIGLTEEGIQKIGVWDSIRGMLDISNDTFTDDEEFTDSMEDEGSGAIYGKHLKVLIALNKPFAMLKKGSQKLKGNDRFEGFSVELIHELSEMIGFEYTFVVQEDKTYGSQNAFTGEWTGMIRQIIDQRVDLAIGDLTITSQREDAIDFTDPFINLGISILFKKPGVDNTPDPWYFLVPFSDELWMYLGIAFVFATLSLFIIGRLAPGEWVNPHPCVKKPDYLENQFDFSNSWWFTLGTLFQQGSSITPRTLPTRIVAVFWWFFVFIMVALYIAQMSFLFIFYTPFIKTPVSKINNIQDLANLDGEIPFGAITSGTTYNFFGTSDNPYYQKIYNWMEQHPEHMIFTNAEGVERVKDGNFAFLMESPAIDYVVQRDCELTRIGGLLDSKGYGIGMEHGSPYRVPLSDAILKLQQNGQLPQMIHKWWKEVDRGFCSSNGIHLSFEQVTVQATWGLFITLILGCVIAFLIGLFLMCFDTAKRAYTLQLPFCDLLRNDMRFFATRANLKIAKVPQKPADAVRPGLPPNQQTTSIQIAVPQNQPGPSRFLSPRPAPTITTTQAYGRV